MASEEQVTLQIDGKKKSPLESKGPPEAQPLNSPNGGLGIHDKVANGQTEIETDVEVVTPGEGDGTPRPVWYKRKCMIVGLMLFIFIIFGAIIGLVIHRFLVGDSSQKPPEYDIWFASYYGDHMVLQRAPQKAHVWGFTKKKNLGEEVTLSLKGAGATNEYTTTVIERDEDRIWSIMLDPVDEKGPFTLTVKMGGQKSTLRDVLFGDVWVCGGQSNMQYDLMSMVKNGSAEIDVAGGFPDVRIFQLAKYSAASPLIDVRYVALHWSLPTRGSLDGPSIDNHFSGLCYLFGKRLNQKLGYPIGLIASAVSATPIELWVPPEVLKSCPVAKLVKYSAHSPPTGHWNAMIHPLGPLSIYGIIWYQGESNAQALSRQYNCTFTALLRSWRHQFQQGPALLTGQSDLTMTKPVIPFGFVQLSANREGPFKAITYGFPDIRWQQTADYGYVPNPEMPNTFMAVSLDLPDPDAPQTPIHPRNKHEVSRRLVRGALAIAYPGITDMNYRFSGPLPLKYRVNKNKRTLRITFDVQPIEVRNDTGFEVCCTEGGTVCPSSNTKHWVNSPIVNHRTDSITLKWDKCNKTHHISAIRYLWRETPCAYLKCPVYDPTTQLPAPPYIYNKIREDTPQDVMFDRTETPLL